MNCVSSFVAKVQHTDNKKKDEWHWKLWTEGKIFMIM